MIGEIWKLYNCGQFLEAYTVSDELANLRQAPDPDQEILAGLLAARLGGGRLSSSIFLRAYRKWPNHPQSLCVGMAAVRHQIGGLAAWLRCRNQELPDHATVTDRAIWAALKAAILSDLYDFDRADQWMEKALALAPNHPELFMRSAMLLEKQNRCEEGLAQALRGVELDACYVPGLLFAAHLNCELGQYTEGMKLLSSVTEQLQSGEVWYHLACLQQKHQDYDAAWHSMQRCLEMWPLADKDKSTQRLLNSQLAELAYLRGDYGKAVAYAKQADQPEHRYTVPHLERLSQASAKRSARESGVEKGHFKHCRSQLTVPYVRQGPYGCGAASMTMLLRYWNRDHSYRQVFQEICYTGTVPYKQHEWLEANGFFTRTFKLTREIAAELIRRGIPFAATTIDPAGSHQFVVVGVDLDLDQLLIQDPNHWESFPYSFARLKNRPHTRVTGTLIVPYEERHRLEDIRLAETEIYRQFHLFVKALAEPPTNASRHLSLLKQIAPLHWITLEACRGWGLTTNRLWVYRRATKRLMKQSPDCFYLKLEMSGYFFQQVKSKRSIKILRLACQKDNSNFFFKKLLAISLQTHAQCHVEAKRRLRQLCKSRYFDSEILMSLGAIFHQENKKNDALECYRFAITLSTRDPQYYLAFFKVAQELDRVPEGLAILEEAVKRDGDLSPLPTITLAQALETLDRKTEAIERLQAATIVHPKNGDLHLTIALISSQIRMPALAERHLEQALPYCHPNQFRKIKKVVLKNLGIGYQIKRVLIRILPTKMSVKWASSKTAWESTED